VVATLHQLINTLMELENSGPQTMQLPPTLQMPLLLDAVEAGKVLSISRAKVLELAARSQIPSLRVGGSVRIPRDQLIEWISNQIQPLSNGSAGRLPTWVRVDRSQER
jgi:excisionase family DNA binding protein